MTETNLGDRKLHICNITPVPWLMLVGVVKGDVMLPQSQMLQIPLLGVN